MACSLTSGMQSWGEDSKEIDFVRINLSCLFCCCFLVPLVLLWPFLLFFIFLSMFSLVFFHYNPNFFLTLWHDTLESQSAKKQPWLNSFSDSYKRSSASTSEGQGVTQLLRGTQLLGSKVVNACLISCKTKSRKFQEIISICLLEWSSLPSQGRGQGGIGEFHSCETCNR